MKFLFFAGIRKKLYPLPDLETKRLVLRKIRKEDAEDMFSYSKNPETSRYLLWEPHPDLSYTQKHLANVLRQYERLTFFDWAVAEKESGRMIGTVGFTAIHDHRAQGEIGYVISPDYHRRGFAPEAIRAILHLGFCELGMKKIVCRIMEDNLASRKVAGRLGFRFAFFEREPLEKRGVKQRVARYELDREEYENYTVKNAS